MFWTLTLFLFCSFMTQTLFIFPPATNSFYELWQTSVFKLSSRPDEAVNSERVQLGSARRTLQNFTFSSFYSCWSWRGGAPTAARKQNAFIMKGLVGKINKTFLQLFIIRLFFLARGQSLNRSFNRSLITDRWENSVKL